MSLVQKQSRLAFLRLYSVSQEARRMKHRAPDAHYHLTMNYKMPGPKQKHVKNKEHNTKAQYTPGHQKYVAVSVCSDKWNRYDNIGQLHCIVTLLGTSGRNQVEKQRKIGRKLQRGYFRSTANRSHFSRVANAVSENQRFPPCL